MNKDKDRTWSLVVEIAESTSLHFKCAFILVNQRCHLLGQLQCKRLQAWRLSAVHHYRLCRLIQRCLHVHTYCIS